MVLYFILPSYKKLLLAEESPLHLVQTAIAQKEIVFAIAMLLFVPVLRMPRALSQCAR